MSLVVLTYQLDTKSNKVHIARWAGFFPVLLCWIETILYGSANRASVKSQIEQVGEREESQNSLFRLREENTYFGSPEQLKQGFFMTKQTLFNFGSKPPNCT